MSNDLWRYLIAGVVILHGIGHVGGPWFFDRSWLAPSLAEGAVRWAFVVLWCVAAVAFVAVGIGIMQQQAWWRPLILTTAVFSFVIAALFLGSSTNQPIVSAIGMDVIILVALLAMRWPSPALIGS